MVVFLFVKIKYKIFNLLMCGFNKKVWELIGNKIIIWYINVWRLKILGFGCLC